MARELLSPHVVMAHWLLLGWAAKWPGTGDVCLLDEGGTEPTSLLRDGLSNLICYTTFP